MQMKVENGLQFKQSLSIFNFPLSTEYAGVVELVDSVDLGAVTSGKAFEGERYGFIRKDNIIVFD